MKSLNLLQTRFVCTNLIIKSILCRFVCVCITFPLLFFLIHKCFFFLFIIINFLTAQPLCIAVGKYFLSLCTFLLATQHKKCSEQTANNLFSCTYSICLFIKIIRKCCNAYSFRLEYGGHKSE